MRKELREQWTRFPAELRRDWETHISQKLSQLIKILETSPQNLFPANNLIGTYAPLESEVHWSKKLSHVFDRLAYPAFLDTGKMEFRVAHPHSLKTRSDFGVEILSPPVDAEVVTPSILIVPGLGFSEEGKRLGRGVGYYDRYLENYNGVKIGLCFEQVLRSDIILEAHDVLMDLIITEENLFIANQNFEFLRRVRWI